MSRYDYIVCQGTYSWVAPEEKEAIRHIVDSCLNPRGIFHLHYVSFSSFYMTAMWHVLRQLAPAEDRDSVERLQYGLQLLGELRDAGAGFFKNHPQALELINTIESQTRSDDESSNLAHNVFAESLTPTYFDEIGADLERMGLRYCGDIEMRLNDPDLCVPGSLRQRFGEMNTPVQKEFFKEFCLPNYGRKDVYIRMETPDPAGARQYLRNSIGAAITEPDETVWQSITTLGRRSFYDFDDSRMQFVFQCLAAGEHNLESIIEMSEYDAQELEDAFKKLVTCQDIELCLPSELAQVPVDTRPISAEIPINKMMLDHSIDSTQEILLIAPALGGWIRIRRPEALLALDACRNGRKDSDSQVRERLINLVLNESRRGDGSLPEFLLDEQRFAHVRRAFLEYRLPLLLKSGALSGDT